MNLITETYKGYTFSVCYDDNPVNPREWCNLGTMYCFHRHYKLGEEHKLSVEEVQDLIAGDEYIWLPLYLIDHSGLAMRTRSYADIDPGEWDSGQVGVIVMPKDAVNTEFGGNVEKALDVLQAEVDTYSDYLQGAVYGYSVLNTDTDTDTDTDNIIDSCWGFYGDSGYIRAVEEAKELIDRLVPDDLWDKRVTDQIKIPFEGGT